MLSGLGQKLAAHMSNDRPGQNAKATTTSLIDGLQNEGVHPKRREELKRRGSSGEAKRKRETGLSASTLTAVSLGDFIRLSSTALAKSCWISSQTGVRKGDDPREPGPEVAEDPSAPDPPLPPPTVEVLEGGPMAELDSAPVSTLKKSPAGKPLI